MYSVWVCILNFRVIYSVLEDIGLLKLAEGNSGEENSIPPQRAGKWEWDPRGVPDSPGPTCGHNYTKSQFYFCFLNPADLFQADPQKLFALSAFFLPNPSWIFLLFLIPLQWIKSCNCPKVFIPAAEQILGSPWMHTIPFYISIYLFLLQLFHLRSRQ